jgi:hypothetical protein
MVANGSFPQAGLQALWSDFLEDPPLAWSAAVLLGGKVSKGRWPSSMGGWSRIGWWLSSGVAGSRGQVQSGGVGGGSTPGHQELLGKDRERKKVGNKVHME